MDPIDIALQEVDRNLSACEAKAKILIAGSSALLTSVSETQSLIVAEGNALWRIYDVASKVLTMAVQMSFDAQLAIGAAFVTKKLKNTVLEPITWSSGDYRFTATPISPPAVVTNNRLPAPRPNSCHMATDWLVSVNDGAPRKFRLLAEFQIDTRTDWPRLKLVISRGVVFSDEVRVPADPLAMLPVKDQVRNRARLEINDHVVKHVESLNLPTPDLSAIPTPLNAVPLAAWPLGSLMLFLKLRDLPQRRAPYALLSSIPRSPFDVALRVKAEMLIANLASVVSGIEGASIGNPRYAGGTFWLTVSIYRKEHQCIAEARIWANIEYSVRIETRGNTRLFFIANQRSWRARWEIDWCFHKCDEASAEIEKTLREQIAQHTYKEILLANLSSIATRASGSMDNFGLTISWEAK